LKNNKPPSLQSAYLHLNELGLGLHRAIVGTGFAPTGNADIGVLVRLQSGPLQPRDLIRLTGLSSAGLSGLGNRLEALKLIHRNLRIGRDGRAVAFELTGVGRRAVEDVTTAMLSEFDAQVGLRREIIRALGFPPPAEQSMNAGSDLTIERLAALGSEITGSARVAGSADGALGPATTVLVATGDGSTRPRDLIDLTELSSGGVTSLLDRLENGGLIVRAAGRRPDRRAVTVELTPAGHAQRDSALSRLASLSDRIVEAIS